MSARIPAGLVYAAIAVVGVVAFGWPFVVEARAGAVDAHAGDAWVWMLVLGVAVVAGLALELRRYAIRAIHVALLGAFSATTALLRLLDLPGGGNAMFFLVILVAAAYGPRFATMLALVSMAASAIVTGGVGPWLAFQMLALAAVAAPVGLVGRHTVRLAPRVEAATLAAAAWGAAFVYGALMNLWTWPLIQDGSAVSYVPGLGLAGTLDRYWSFYVLTSFAWDAAGALANALLVGLLARPVLARLRAISPRLDPRIVWH